MEYEQVFIEHEPLHPQLISGVASCEIKEDMVHWTFYVDKPNVSDGLVRYEKVLCGWLVMSLQAYLAARMVSQAALAQHIVDVTAQTLFN